MRYITYEYRTYSRVSNNEYSRETPKVDSLWGKFVTGGWFGGEAPIWERVLHGQLDSLWEIFVTGCFVIGDSTVVGPVSDLDRQADADSVSRGPRPRTCVFL